MYKRQAQSELQFCANAFADKLAYSDIARAVNNDCLLYTSTPAFADQEPPLPTSSATKTILTAAHWGPMLVETDGENVLSSRGALALSLIHIFMSPGSRSAGQNA